jgi:hypothetical protein
MPLKGSDSIAECSHVPQSGDMIIVIQGMEVEGNSRKKLNSGT